MVFSRMLETMSAHFSICHPYHFLRFSLDFFMYSHVFYEVILQAFDSACLYFRANPTSLIKCEVTQKEVTEEREHMCVFQHDVYMLESMRAHCSIFHPHRFSSLSRFNFLSLFCIYYVCIYVYIYQLFQVYIKLVSTYYVLNFHHQENSVHVFFWLFPALCLLKKLDQRLGLSSASMGGTKQD